MPLPVASSDITILDFAIQYDISGPIPSIVLTNMSVGNPSGTTGLNLCTWWYVITTPSGTFIHQGSVTAPDIIAANWTTLTIPANSWPTPFGTPPCGQVEFSCSVPYVCTLFVKDAASTIFSYAKPTTICRPSGSDNNTCGSFGGANVLVEVQCQNAQIYAQDATNYTYQNLLGTSQSSIWTLRYPADASGDLPANKTAINAPYVYFPVGYSGEGYTIYLQTFAVYNLGNECSVKIQYKLFSGSGVGTGKTFGVWCNIDLCKLDCEMQKFYDLVKTSCGQVENPELKQKALEINLLYNRLLTGIVQPLCNIDVPKIIHQIEKIGGFTCDCCCGAGINVGNPVPPANGNGGCCPTKSPVYIIGTTNAPAACPGSYFPTQVYDPTGATIIGTANSADDLVAMLNNNTAWAAFGTAFNEGNCQVGWYASNAGTVIPPVFVAGATVITTCMGNTQNYTVQVIDFCFPTTPITLSSFPMNVYVNFGLGAGSQFAGNVASQAAMIAALNAISGKPATITFSAGATPAAINIFNSSCADYAGVIAVNTDAGSGNFLLYGANHTSIAGLTPTKNGELGIGLRDGVVLGRIAGADPTKHMWHTIRLNNYLVVSEADTGKIYFYDITVPLMPTLARTIQLNDTGSGTCFTGVPNSVYVVGEPSSPSFYGLYFPTDYLGNVTINALPVVESITGSAWLINFSDPGSGVTTSFADAKLLGKCPRVVSNGTNRKQTLYFTQDGSMEQLTPLSSGVANGSIVALALDTFSSGGLTTHVLRAGHSNGWVWAASFDGSQTIYFITQDNTLVTYDVIALAPTGTYEDINPTVSGISDSRINTRYWNGNLYISSFHFAGTAAALTQGVFVGSLPLTSNFPVADPQGFNHFNVLPLGNCLMVVTMWDGSLNRLALGLFKLDGTFLEYIGGFATAPTNESVYNLVYVPGINIYTPNNLVP